ncbi:MAG: calcium/sodium antiporter [Nitrosomonas ureae]
MIEQILYFIVGLGLLTLGGHLLVTGASEIAKKFGVPALIIGLTVVAYGTSAPEVAVSVKSAMAGQGDIAVGNVIGSNIFNVLFILGLSALILPLVVSSEIVKREAPIMLGVSLLGAAFAWDGQIAFWESAVLAFGAVVYTVFQIWLARKSPKDPLAEQEVEALKTSGTQKPVGFYVGYIVAGLVLLVVGSRYLIDAAVYMARLMDIDEVVIGLTIVAAGTSVPEVATSIIAALKGERDIAVGNVVGSNIFNILAALGLSGLAAGQGLVVQQGVLAFDLPIMVAVAFACLPIFYAGSQISRFNGFGFLAYYLIYLVFLIAKAKDHAALGHLEIAFWYFVAPITAATILISVYQARRVPSVK